MPISPVSITKFESASTATASSLDRKELSDSVKKIRTAGLQHRKESLTKTLGGEETKPSLPDLLSINRLKLKPKRKVDSTKGKERHRVNNEKWEEFQQEWQGIADKSAVNGKKPEALIRFNYRYVVNNNTGAMKYQPILVDELLNNAAGLETTYYQRQINDPSPRQSRSQSNVTLSHCETKIAPAQKEGIPLIVPSVGMPKEFKDDVKLQALYWYNESVSRPVYLFVHQSELGVYDRAIGDKLRRKGIGLIGWEYPGGQVGFGATRKAAVDFSSANGFNKSVMMDSNVAQSEFDLISTADRASLAQNDSLPLYIGLGATSGNTYRNMAKMENNQLVQNRDIKSRPVEQLTMWDNKVQFDPAFITSSEDIDASNDTKFFNGINKRIPTDFKDFKLHDTTFKSFARIKKFELTLLSNVYNKLVNVQLTNISEKEKNIVVRVKTGSGEDAKVHDVPLGTVSRYIATKLNKDYARIQSLIVEKMLVNYKDFNSTLNYQLKPHAPTMSETVSELSEEATNVVLKRLKKRMHEGTTAHEQREYSKRSKMSHYIPPFIQH